MLLSGTTPPILLICGAATAIAYTDIVSCTLFGRALGAMLWVHHQSFGVRRIFGGRFLRVRV